MKTDYKFKDKDFEFLPIYRVSIDTSLRENGYWLGRQKYNGHAMLLVSTDKAVLIRLQFGDKSENFYKEHWVSKKGIIFHACVGRYNLNATRVEWATYARTERAQGIIYNFGKQAMKMYFKTRNEKWREYFTLCERMYHPPMSLGQLIID